MSSTVVYRVVDRSTPDVVGTLIWTNHHLEDTRIELRETRSGEERVRLILLDSGKVTYCGSTAVIGDGGAGLCVAEPAASAADFIPLTSERRRIAITRQTTRTILNRTTSCFRMAKRARPESDWTECYTAEGVLVFADGLSAAGTRSLFDFDVNGSSVQSTVSTSGETTLEASSIDLTVAKDAFSPPYPISEPTGGELSPAR